MNLYNYNYLSIWHLGILITVLTLFQAKPGYFWRYQRRKSTPAPQRRVICQTAWSSWGKCEPFCADSPKKTRHRQVIKGNKCVNDQQEQSCSPAGCRYSCDEENRKCGCLKGFAWYGNKCTDVDECKPNGGRGPCSHSCHNFHASYVCRCRHGYRKDGSTRCALLDCKTPQFSRCPVAHSQLSQNKWNGGLPICKSISQKCFNGTTFNSECTLSCPSNYGLALKDPGEPWRNYSAFDFSAPSNRVMCQVKLKTTTFWHLQLANYYCRRLNDPPLSIHLDKVYINEKLPPGTSIGNLTAIERQSNQRIIFSTHSLIGKPLFHCTGSTLKSSLVFKWKPQSANLYSVLIRAQDNGLPSMWTEQVFNITVINVNDPPRDIEISNNRVHESASVGTVVGTLSAIDDDLGEERTSNFSWKLDTHEHFNISGAKIVLKKRLSYDRFKVHYLRVSCSDSKTFSEKELLLYVINSIDPPILSLSNSKIPENSPAGTVIGTIEANSESNQDMTFNLSASFAHAQTKFSLSPSPTCHHNKNAKKYNTTCVVNLTVSGYLDFEVQSRYVVQVFVWNNQSCNFRKWNISIENVNESPEKLEFNGMNSIPETTKSGEDIGIITVTDPDNWNAAIQRHSCHVVNKAGDGEHFQINNITNALQVKVNKTLNYERQQMYHVRVTCTDSGRPPLSLTQDFIINVTDTDEPIQNISLSNNQVLENATVGTIIGILDAYDPDIHRPKSMTFSIVAPRPLPFILQGPNNTQLVLNHSLNFEENSTFVVTIRVTDTAGRHLQWPFRINILDVNDPPSDIILLANTVNETLEPGSLIGDITLVDEDEITVASCEILNNNDERVSVNGTMLIAGEKAIDYETDLTHSLEISLKCCDQTNLCLIKNFSIKIIDINEPPTDITIDNLHVVENRNDITIGKITVHDPDKDQKHSCTLSNTTETEDKYFRIGNANKTLQLLKKLNFEEERVRSFKITCREVGNEPTLSLTKTFDLNILDINEAPTQGCSNPFYVSPEQSLGTVLGSLNVTDPDNEIVDLNVQDPCQPKQCLSYTTDTTNSDFPFRVFDGYLVKTGAIEVHQTYDILITVEDDGVVVTSMDSARTVDKKKSVQFNCTVLAVPHLKPHITLSSNQVDQSSTTGTVIGYLNTTGSAQTTTGYHNNKEYDLIKDGCTNYPFMTVENSLTLNFNEEPVYQQDDFQIPNYIIIHVKNRKGNWSSDVIDTRFLIIIRGDKKITSRMCLTNQPILREKMLDTKLGSVRIYQDHENKTDEKCPENINYIDQKQYFCKVKLALNESSRDFRKVNCSNAIYIDPEMSLRTNILLSDMRFSFAKLVAHVECLNSEKPLMTVKGKVTANLRNCWTVTVKDGIESVCEICKDKACSRGQTCVNLPYGYECKKSYENCEDKRNARYNSLCSDGQCPDNSLCSRRPNTKKRCVPRSNQLFFSLNFIMYENSSCKFEDCLAEILEYQDISCLQDWSDHRRQKRDTRKQMKKTVEILHIDRSQRKKKSLVYAAVWKSERDGLQLYKQPFSSFKSFFHNTTGVKILKTEDDCLVIQYTGIQCPINTEPPKNERQEKSAFQEPKVQAAFGAGVAIISIIVITVFFYCLKKRRNAQKEKMRRQSTAVVADFNNLAFDGTEMKDIAAEKEKQSKKVKNDEKINLSFKKNKKQKKRKHDFKNPVYEQPEELKMEIYNENYKQSSIYSEPQEQENILQRPKVLSNPFYAKNEKILVRKPQSSQKNGSVKSFENDSINEKEMLNPRDKARLCDPAFKYPYYEELPPIKKNSSSRSGSDQRNTASDVGNKGMSAYYHVLEPDENTDGQDNRDKEAGNKANGPPVYFVLEEDASKDKNEYQSLHRELDAPPPAYATYKLTEKSGTTQDDQAAKSRTYEVPFAE